MKIEQFRRTALFLAACMVLTGPARAEEVQNNQKIYSAKCGSCHGKDAKGNAGMAKMLKAESAALDLLDEATLGKTDEELVKLTTEGLGKMPAYKGKLSEAEISGVVAYLRELSKPKEDAPAESKPEASAGPDGAPLYASKCASCHAKDAKGNPGMAKMLKAEPGALDLLDGVTLAKSDEDLVKVTTEGLGKMPAYKGKLTEADIAAIIKYLRAQAK